jgi:hypothetical protein
MENCLKENILNIEIYTNTNGYCGCGSAKYTITVYDSSGKAVCGAQTAGGVQDFVLPDGEYKISVTGDAYASPRMQQRWLTICSKDPQMHLNTHFGVIFVFDRVSGTVQPPKPLPCPNKPKPCPNMPAHQPCCRRHPCAPVQSPFMPSMYVAEWEKRNHIENYVPCGHSQTHSVHNPYTKSEYLKATLTPPPTPKKTTQQRNSPQQKNCNRQSGAKK